VGRSAVHVTLGVLESLPLSHATLQLGSFAPLSGDYWLVSKIAC